MEAAAAQIEDPIEQDAIASKPTKPKRKPKILKAMPPEAEKQAEPEAKAKPERPSKSTKPAGGFRYEGSLSQKWDQVLETGGTWEDMAKECDVSPGRLRAHAKHRTGRGSHTLKQDGDNVKLIPA